MKPLFQSTQQALNHFLQQAQDLEQKHGRSFEDLFLEAEHSMDWTPEQEEIFHLSRQIDMCKNLMRKENLSKKPL